METPTLKKPSYTVNASSPQLVIVDTRLQPKHVPVARVTGVSPRRLDDVPDGRREPAPGSSPHHASVPIRCARAAVARYAPSR